MTVPNVTPLTGTVTPLADGSHRVLIDPFAVEHRDGYGTWTMHIELGELVAIELAPRATDDTGRSAWSYEPAAP